MPAHHFLSTLGVTHCDKPFADVLDPDILIVFNTPRIYDEKIKSLSNLRKAPQLTCQSG